MAVKWTPELSVGVEKIDEQHRELFERINNLVQAIKESRCKYDIPDVIRFLEEYVVEHFGAEEEIMQKSGYPGLDAHKARHAEFMRNFAELKAQYEAIRREPVSGANYDLSATTNQVVVDWIIEHISKVDKALGEFLKKQS